MRYSALDHRLHLVSEIARNVKDGTPERQRQHADLFSSWSSCCQEVRPYRQRKWDHGSRNMVIPELPRCQNQLCGRFRVRWTGLAAMIVTSAIIHIRWRTALTALFLVFAPNGRNGLAVHTCRQIFCARSSALHMEGDKACLVPRHYCEHAKTRKAERTQSNGATAWLL